MDTRRVLRWIVPAGALALAGFLFISQHQKGDAPKSVPAGSPQRIEPTTVVPPPPPATPRNTAASADESQKSPDLKQQFQSSGDLYSFAESLIEHATAGDPVSQYYLAHTLKYCDSLYGFYFIRGKTRRTLDEGMQWASTRPGISAEEARDVYARCHRLNGAEPHPFGAAEKWLTSAKDSGQVLAMMDFAQDLASKADVSGALASADMRDEAKRLAMEALRSKDPAVIFKFGDLAMLFLGNEEKASEAQWVWRVAGCVRGYDCGQDAEWLQFQCRFDYNCQPQDDGMEFIRRNNPQSFDAIQAKAKALIARIDANELESLFDPAN